MIRFSARILCLFFGLLQFSAAAEDPKLLDPSVLPPLWDKETIAVWEKLPIQDGGRIKPLYTFAKYELLRTRGMESLRLKLKAPDPATGKKTRDLTAIQWLMDSLFHPETAKQYPCFTVDDGEALVRVGLTPHPAKRDQYSYNELIPARDQLARLQDDVDRRKQEAKDQNNKAQIDHLEEMAANLARNLGAYESILQAMAPLRRKLEILPNMPDADLAKLSPSIPTSTAIQLLQKNSVWQQLSTTLTQQSAPDPTEEAMMNIISMVRESEAWKTKSPRSFAEMGKFGPALEGWLKENDELVKKREGLATVVNLAPFMILDMKGSSRLTIVPPLDGKGATWHPVGDIPKKILNNSDGKDLYLTLLQKGEQAVQAASGSDYQKGIASFGQALRDHSKAIADTDTVHYELLYRKADLLSKAKIAFFLIFILVAVCWLAPNARWSRGLFKVMQWAIFLPLLAIVATFIWRLLIGCWAPVTNLYETIPWITLVAAGLAVFSEFIFKNKLALGIGAFLGGCGMFMAGAFEASEAADTIRSLEAVLRSSFWLWTHVLCEVIAYGSFIVGSAFSIVYIIARSFDLPRTYSEFFKMLTSCAFGILCFTLLFVLVGTVLGGIWGNYSWGRFWGWDPKENGALVITLWCLAVVHMRLGGWIKEFGLHIMNVLGLATVVFSWWHVNELGVGLHAYGKTEGRLKWIMIAYGIVLTLTLAGWVVSIFAARAVKQRRLQA